VRISERPLISEEAITRRVAELAETVSRAYDGRPLTAVVVLKGGLFFAADLLRRLTVPVTVEFMRARSYEGTDSSGVVEVLTRPDRPLTGANVLLVEDIVDTGRTTRVLLDALAQDRPASVALCALLDKPARRVVPVAAEFTGFAIEDAFVVGYGLDLDGAYRNLPAVHVMEP
jgi:hypoxanthine phosphoribosyltransferase